MLTIFIVLLCAHCFGDFLLQTNGMVRNKGKWGVLLVHALIRAFGYDEPWGRDIHRYLDFQGFRYWTMGFVMSVTIIINRCELGTRDPHPSSDNPQMFYAKPASPETKLHSPH